MSTVTRYRQLLTKYTPQPIRSQKDYKQALSQLEEFVVPHPNAASSLLIEMLATLIEKYESRQFPTPKIAPAEMLAKLLKTEGVSSAEVANKTGIPASTISNVLANRRGISKQNAIRLGEYFGLSPIVFLDHSPQKKSTID